MTCEAIKPNDQVSVQLTLVGANALNKQALRLREQYPSQVKDYIKANYKAGEWYASKLWSIMNDFGPLFTISASPPFTELRKL